MEPLLVEASYGIEVLIGEATKNVRMRGLTLSHFSMSNTSMFVIRLKYSCKNCLSYNKTKRRKK